MAERCEMTELPTDMCAHCLGHREEPTAPARTALAVADRPWFTALYPGRCAGCGEPFQPGAQIRMAAPTGWLAVCCEDD